MSKHSNPGRRCRQQTRTFCPRASQMPSPSPLPPHGLILVVLHQINAYLLFTYHRHMLQLEAGSCTDRKYCEDPKLQETLLTHCYGAKAWPAGAMVPDSLFQVVQLKQMQTCFASVHCSGGVSCSGSGATCLSSALSVTARLAKASVREQLRALRADSAVAKADSWGQTDAAKQVALLVLGARHLAACCDCLLLNGWLA